MAIKKRLWTKTTDEPTYDPDRFMRSFAIVLRMGRENLLYKRSWQPVLVWLEPISVMSNVVPSVRNVILSLVSSFSSARNGALGPTD